MDNTLAGLVTTLPQMKIALGHLVRVDVDSRQPWQYEPWFAFELDRVAEYVGTTRSALVDMLCSANANRRELAYLYLASYLAQDDSYLGAWE